MAKKDPRELRPEDPGGRESGTPSGLPRPEGSGKASRRAPRGGGEGPVAEPGAREEGLREGLPEVPRSERGGKSFRDAILDAAEDLIVERGAAGASLDKVAARAGVSKGGLLHHFPSKNALAQALIQRVAESFDDVRAEERGEGPLDAELIIRTHISWWNRVDSKRRRLYTSLLVATAHDPALVAPLALECQKELRNYEEAGIPPGRVSVIMMALHGLWMTELLGITLGDYNQRLFMDELFRLAKTSSPEGEKERAVDSHA